MEINLAYLIVYLMEFNLFNLILFLYSRGRIMTKLLKVNIQKELKEFDLHFRSFWLWKKYDIEIHCRYCKS